jgi:hypothetical protein
MGYWIIDTAGIGSIIALGVAGTVFLIYAGVVRWIHDAPAPKSPAPTADGQEPR